MALTDSGSGRVVLTNGLQVHGVSITLADTVEIGDILGYNSGWVRAIATTGGVVQARLVALGAGVSGDVIEATPICQITGYTGGTPGGLVYVDEAASADGNVIEVAPTTSGDADTVIGTILDATTILININPANDSTAP